MSTRGPVRADRELILLAATEAFERFSYYGVRGLLVLFLTASAASGGMAWSAESALRLLGWFTALVYVLPVVGGLLGDRLTGPRPAVQAGAVVLVGAYGLLAASAAGRSNGLMFAALALIAVGTGLFKPNITALVGSLFDGDERRREGGFLVFYLFMNVGVVSCGLVVGTLGERFAWYLGFTAAAVAMVASIAVFSRSEVRGAARSSVPAATSVAGAPARSSLTSAERAGIALIGILGVFATVFWMGLDQTAGLLNLFAFERTQRELAGFTVPATWFQSLNPLFIIALAPGFAWLWTRLGARGRDPRTEWKFVLGLLSTAGAFAVMSLAAGHPAGALSSPAWLLGAYLLLTVGELCIWTISLAAVTRFAPQRHVSLVVGVWYLAIAIGGWCAGQIGALVADMPMERVFALLATIFATSAVALSAITPLTARLLHRALPRPS
jgi:POT family proton-dependent oligopeptide transporter